MGYLLELNGLKSQPLGDQAWVSWRVALGTEDGAVDAAPGSSFPARRTRRVGERRYAGHRFVTAGHRLETG